MRGRPFPKGHCGPGRPKGCRNKVTAVQEHLVAAFSRCASDDDWDDLAKAAMDQALKGKPNLLTAILPFVARKMPERVELDQTLAMTPEEIDRKWAKQQKPE